MNLNDLLKQRNDVHLDMKRLLKDVEKEGRDMKAPIGLKRPY